VTLRCLALPLASQKIRGRLASRRTYYRLPRPVSLFRAASLADALAGRLFFYGLVRILPAPYITGAYLIAILMPLLISLDFNDFHIRKWKILSILVVFWGAFSH
jgi:hypothetical protein